MLIREGDLKLKFGMALLQFLNRQPKNQYQDFRYQIKMIRLTRFSFMNEIFYLFNKLYYIEDPNPLLEGYIEFYSRHKFSYGLVLPSYEVRWIVMTLLASEILHLYSGL